VLSLLSGAGAGHTPAPPAADDAATFRLVGDLSASLKPQRAHTMHAAALAEVDQLLDVAGRGPECAGHADGQLDSFVRIWRAGGTSMRRFSGAPIARSSRAALASKAVEAQLAPTA